MIAICTMLVIQLGPAAFAGIGILFALTPVQGILYRKLAGIRKAIAPVSDKRVKGTQEVLQGIRVIKFFAWESAFLDQIEKLRGEEMVQIKRKSILGAFVNAIVFTIPVVAASISFVIYSLTNPLDPAEIFAALAWFSELRFPLMFLPQVLVGLADFKVAVKRIGELLLAPELDMEPVVDEKSEFGVQVVDGNFLWEAVPKKEEEKKVDKKSKNKDKKQVEEEEKLATEDTIAPEEIQPLLKNLNLKVKKGDLVAIVGSVGSGKSSLLNALIGEMKCLSGDVIFSGSVGYAPQQAWIQNTTLEKNITFGQEFNQERYEKAIRVCALKKDIEILQDGDQTEIGERGINLSGGQKQRVNLARCVYFDTDIVLLDDPLSAVDGMFSSLS